MKYIFFYIPLFFVLSLAISAQSFETSCEKAHKQALLKCKAYEHHISAGQIRSIGRETRVRVAEKEVDKLYGMGKSCAEAQKTCKEACTSSTNENHSKLDITDLIELQSDCSEGQVAEHRSKLAEKYLKMKAILEESRIPASQ